MIIAFPIQPNVQANFGVPLLFVVNPVLASGGGGGGGGGGPMLGTESGSPLATQAGTVIAV